ncbi:Bcl-2-like protein, partial [Monkeypox virus]
PSIIDCINRHINMRIQR